MKLIDKDAVFAEIDRMFDKHSSKHDIDEAGVVLLQLRENVENLEVKEVDLEKEVEDYWHNSELSWCRDAYSMTHIRTMLSSIAKHFFELGLNASNPLTWEDIRNIDHILDGMRNENQVFGYPKFHEEALRRFKALKGE